MRSAIVDNGIVLNIIETSGIGAYPGAVPCSESCDIGDDYNLDLAKQESEKASQDAAIVAEKINILWAAANSHESNYISGGGWSLLTVGITQQKPKSIAVSLWSKSIWMEYFRRKELVTPSCADNLDFSEFGAIPYSVPELQAEVGM